MRVIPHVEKLNCAQISTAVLVTTIGLLLLLSACGHNSVDVQGTADQLQAPAA